MTSYSVHDVLTGLMTAFIARTVARSAVQVAATHDKYVHADECEQLHTSLQAAVDAGDRGSSLHWIPGGHATAFVWQKEYFVQHCADAAEKAAAAWSRWESAQDGTKGLAR
jgi:hypothetical protein